MFRLSELITGGAQWSRWAGARARKRHAEPRAADQTGGGSRARTDVGRGAARREHGRGGTDKRPDHAQRVEAAAQCAGRAVHERAVQALQEDPSQHQRRLPGDAVGELRRDVHRARSRAATRPTCTTTSRSTSRSTRRRERSCRSTRSSARRSPRRRSRTIPTAFERDASRTMCTGCPSSAPARSSSGTRSSSRRPASTRTRRRRRGHR